MRNYYDSPNDWLQNCRYVSMPQPPCVALLGDFSSEYVDIRSIAAGFGWSVALVNDFSELATLQGRLDLVAVLIHAKTIGTSWGNALSRVRYVAPQARAVVCHGIDQAHSRREMLERGAYGVLRSPLDSDEVRQMLGFVWAAQNRLPALAETETSISQDSAERAAAVRYR